MWFGRATLVAAFASVWAASQTLIDFERQGEYGSGITRSGTFLLVFVTPIGILVLRRRLQRLSADTVAMPK